jgi:AmmeMemoRadiSam system protein B/AmmeMemoRadiSam system protein A
LLLVVAAAAAVAGCAGEGTGRSRENEETPSVAAPDEALPVERAAPRAERQRLRAVPAGAAALGDAEDADTDEEPPAAPEETQVPVRGPVAAGGFYPAAPDALRREVEGYVATAEKVKLPGRVIAIIAPHAGYAYSGPAAGWAYKQLEGADFESVILIGGHESGMSRGHVWEGSYRSPLGPTSPDAEIARLLVEDGFAREPVDGDPGLHGLRDHALEVHVPFIQVVLPRARVVPVYFNRPDRDVAARAGEAMAGAARNRKAVIVCSTDFSHYPDAATAELADKAILEAICSLDSKRILETDRELLGRHRGRDLQCTVCGLGAVLATVEAAKRLGAAGARVVRYEHSGSRVRKNRRRVVGYGAVAIYGVRGTRSDSANDAKSEHVPPKTAVGPRKVSPRPSDRMLTDEERKTLLALARKSLELAFESRGVPGPERTTPALKMKTGAFVTIHNRGRLRGCIGSFGRDAELWRVVGEYARRAAFHDPRPGLGNVTKAELPRVDIEISVLSPLRKLENPLDLRLGTDGVWIVGANGRTGTYLPQVAEHFRTKEEFLSDCCRNKAGLASGAWRDPRQATVYAYTAEVFSEGGQRGK